MKKSTTKASKKSVKDTLSYTAESVGAVVQDFGTFVTRMGGSAKNAGNTVIQKAKSIEQSLAHFTAEDVIREAMKLPLVKVDRAKFLKKELFRFYPEEIVNKAIEKNPAFAGIEQERINKIARQVINYETNKVTAISFMAGVPGGIAMAATVPADLTQYFGSILNTMQKLAYLYGFEDFNLSEEEVSDETMNQVLVFLGVMFGVRGANTGVKAIAEVVTHKVSKSLAQKALTKTTYYPIVKKVSQVVGIRMTKQIFADSVSKVVPVAGGIVSGCITYASFKPCVKKLQKSFKELSLSNPEFYRDSAII